MSSVLAMHAGLLTLDMVDLEVRCGAVTCLLLRCLDSLLTGLPCGSYRC